MLSHKYFLINNSQTSTIYIELVSSLSFQTLDDLDYSV